MRTLRRIIRALLGKRRASSTLPDIKVNRCPFENYVIAFALTEDGIKVIESERPSTVKTTASGSTTEHYAFKRADILALIIKWRDDYNLNVEVNLDVRTIHP